MLAKKAKRMLSLLLTLVMILGMLPTSVFAAVPEDAKETQKKMQILDEGGVTYYKADGTTGTEGNYAVKLTKTVNPTGIENRFTINLEVETKQNIEKLEMAPDAAVVLVFDVSGSMTAASGGGKSRVEHAKEAAQAFLKTYVEDAGNAQRKVAVVEFGTNAKTLLNWTEANAGGAVNSAVAEAVDNVDTDFTYNYCTRKGVHTCTIDCTAFITNDY